MQTTSKGFKKPDNADNADLKIFVGDNMDLLETELDKKVDATKKASATELGLIKIGTGLSIDANGVVTASGGGGGIGDKDTTSGFKASSNSTQAISAGAVIKLIFGLEDFDNKGEYDSATGRFTAQEAGIYLFTGNVRFTTTTGTDIFLSFYKNGVNDTRVQQFTNGGSTAKAVQAHGNVLMKLNAGDYVEVYTYSSIACSTQGYDATGYHTTFFSGVRLA